MHSHGVLNKCISKIVTNFNDDRPLVVHIMYVRWTTSLYCVGQGTWGTDTLCAWFSMKLEQVQNDTHNDNTLRFIHVLWKKWPPSTQLLYITMWSSRQRCYGVQWTLTTKETMAIRHLAFILVWCTRRSTTCAVKDDNGVRTSSKMDDIVIHLDDIVIYNKRNGWY